MSNLDTIILNASGQTVREDIQANLQAIKGNNSAGTLPAADSNTLINYMTIADTGNSQLKVHIGTSNTFVPIIDISQGVSSGTHVAKPGTTSFPGYRFLNSDGNASQSGMGLPADTRVGLFVAGGEKLSVLNDGKVGINVTSPMEALDVRGNAIIQTNTGDAILSVKSFIADDSNRAYIDLTASMTQYEDYGLRIIRDAGGPNVNSMITHRGTGSFVLDCDEQGKMEFKTDSTVRWTIFGDKGNLVSGTNFARDLLATHGAGFNFNGDNFEGLALVKNAYGWGTPLFIQLLNASGSRNLVEFQYNTGGSGTGTAVGFITTNGSSTTYATSSDYRLKENVVAISDGITRLKTLKPYRFNFISDKDTTVDGFFAHEVTAVPEAVIGTKDETDSDNNPKYQGIDQSKIVPLLVAALQEAVAKIETLETKVAALEGS